MRANARTLLEQPITAYRGNKRQTRMLVIALIVFAVLGNSILRFTSTPRFCNGCHEIKPAYQSWQISIHSEVPCENCHIPTGHINYMTHKLRALRNIVIHIAIPDQPEVPIIQPKIRVLINSLCSRCHSPNRTMAYSGGLYVPHKKHMDKGLMCTTCHAKLVHGQGGQKARKPTMDTCMICHNGTRAPEACGICHITLAITEERAK